MTDGPMDIFERAQEADAAFTAQAIAAALPPAPTGPSAEICVECGDDIPEARREAQPGCTLCAACKSNSEHAPGGRK